MGLNLLNKGTKFFFKKWPNLCFQAPVHYSYNDAKWGWCERKRFWSWHFQSFFLFRECFYCDPNPWFLSSGPGNLSWKLPLPHFTVVLPKTIDAGKVLSLKGWHFIFIQSMFTDNSEFLHLGNQVNQIDFVCYIPDI